MLPNDLNSWADLLERTANNQIQGLELDDALLGFKQITPFLDIIRRLCLCVPDLFPKPGVYCSPEGDRFLLDMATVLRLGEGQTRIWLLAQAKKYDLVWLSEDLLSDSKPKW